MAYIRRPFIGNIMTVHSAHRLLYITFTSIYKDILLVPKFAYNGLHHIILPVHLPWIGIGAPCVKKNKLDVIRKLVKDVQACKSPAEKPQTVGYRLCSRHITLAGWSSIDLLLTVTFFAYITTRAELTISKIVSVRKMTSLKNFGWE